MLLCKAKLHFRYFTFSNVTINVSIVGAMLLHCVQHVNISHVQVIQWSSQLSYLPPETCLYSFDVKYCVFDYFQLSCNGSWVNLNIYFIPQFLPNSFFPLLFMLSVLRLYWCQFLAPVRSFVVYLLLLLLLLTENLCKLTCWSLRRQLSCCFFFFFFLVLAFKQKCCFSWSKRCARFFLAKIQNFKRTVELHFFPMHSKSLN